MSLELHHTSTCLNWAAKTQENLYKNCQSSSLNHFWLMRFSGLGVGLASATIATIGTVGRVGETAIKGLTNIFGAPCSDNCNFLKGLKQIFIQLPLSILNLIFIPIPAAGNLLIDPLGMLISPVAYSSWKQNLHKEESDRFSLISSPWTLAAHQLIYGEDKTLNGWILVCG